MRIFKTIMVLGVFILLSKYAYPMCTCTPEDEWSIITPLSSFVELSNGCNCKGCKAPCYHLVEKLNLNSGIYETVGQYPWNLGYSIAYNLSHNRIFTNETINPTTFHAISISDMKVAGTFTLDISSSGENVCQLEGEPFLIDPNGSRIAVSNISDEKNCTQAIEIFDLNTYKPVNTLYNMSLDEFSSDGKLLYTYSKTMGITKYIYLINPSNGSTLKTISLKEIDKGVKLVSKVVGDVNGDLVLISEQKRDSAGTVTSTIFSYNIDTGIVSPKIVPGSYGASEFGDNGKYIVFDALTVSNAAIVSRGWVHVYDTSTGNKIAGLTITQNTGKGAIISWPDDHTFIYNTTQKLIYFDIKQNKIIKELPIIRPWEQKGWKPEVK